MGADTKSLRSRIKSVDSTLHLTKAMGLVASSKIRRATDAMLKGREYAETVRDMMELLTACPECSKSPYLQEQDGDKTRLIVIAGDRGLAGGYNANVFRLSKDYPNADMIAIGKRACERYGDGYASSESFACSDAIQLSKELCSDFVKGEFDRLGIISTKYISMMTQQAQITWLLPLERSSGKMMQSVLFEPDEIQILNTAVPEYITGIIMAAVRESFACEVAARRMAMDSAGKNAQQMIDSLQLAYNRARQGAITQEITEIVAGSGA